MDESLVKQLEEFIDLCKSNPCFILSASPIPASFSQQVQSLLSFATTSRVLAARSRLPAEIRKGASFRLIQDLEVMESLKDRAYRAFFDGYKSCGIARAMLGQWEEAAKDLHVTSKLDKYEEISAVLKKVEPKAHKLEEHRRKYGRLPKERNEKAEREGRRCRAEAQAANEKAKKQDGGGMPGCFLPGRRIGG